MESGFSSVIFKGSIPEAIMEAKSQKKLFVVYISGEDDQSVRMESSTLADDNVVKALSRYCIVLHLSAGSIDAANFSAICILYKQKSVPCITAVGYNGVQIWQREGFVSYEELIACICEANLNLDRQLTALSAPFAYTYEKSAPDSDEECNSTEIVSPSIEKDVRFPEARLPSTSEIIEQTIAFADKAENINIDLAMEPSSKSGFADELEISVDEKSTSLLVSQKELSSPGEVGLENSHVGHNSPSDKHADAVLIVENNATDHNSGISEVSPMVAIESNEILEKNKARESDTKKSASNEVHLNVRLPDGSMLQEKFLLTSALMNVKDSVNKRQGIGLGSYDLAIPYPRKVFNDQDLSRSLSELGLLNRQALIVVPHQRSSGHFRGGSPSHDLTNSTQNVYSSTESNGGYFAYARSFLSYFNPFSYLGGRASSSNSSPNPANQNTERTPSTRSVSNTSRNENRNIGPSTSRIGANIHTLRRDEDDEGRFGDRNTFWNGNSTQYGGGDNNDSNK